MQSEVPNPKCNCRIFKSNRQHAKIAIEIESRFDFAHRWKTAVYLLRVRRRALALRFGRLRRGIRIAAIVDTERWTGRGLAVFTAVERRRRQPLLRLTIDRR